MNKYIFSILLLLSLFLLTSVSFAVTNTPTPKEEKEGIEKQINDLTEKIASRVAQLKLVEKRGLIGKVTDVSSTQITISDIHNNTRFVDVDELTKFSSPNTKSSFGISDIEKDSTIGILGLYNKESRRIMARFVTVLNHPRYIHGTISSIDEDNFQVAIKTKENDELNIDVGTTTITSSVTSSLKLTKSGFSKLNVGDYIIVVGFEDKKDKNLIIASKIIAFPDLNMSSEESSEETPIPTKTNER
ncbi:MAG: hypothetical protein HYT08_04440 [Candidatus Levybacteria bacterium]|nr:hypothetical protein [Candidatus Levybacteria bacterium]